MEKLKRAWHYEFDGLKTLEVTKCEQLENIFPSDMHAATFGSLETLMVSDCGSMEEIFQLSSEMSSAEDTTQLKQLTLVGLPKLKQIWSRDPQNISCFPNMQVVCIEKCESLEYLFPFSVAKNMLQLEEITIKDAKRMKVIVSKREGGTDSGVIFEFNHLTSLVLENLNELRGFFAGEHSLACPSLRELDVFSCTKLKLFKTHCTSSRETISGSKLQVALFQPLLTLEEVICNLERLNINNEDASMILQGQITGDHFPKLEELVISNFKDDQATFPYWFLLNISGLESLVVQWSSFKEIFGDERSLDEKGQIKIRPQIKRLLLYQLHELKHICEEGSLIDPVLEVLEDLDVDQCSNLKHLVPSCVTFSCLTYLEVKNCNGLVNLITSSTARSLVRLTEMVIRECNSLEQIVIDETEEANGEVAFNSLVILKLECLPKLKKFLSSKCLLKFPLLEKFVVKKCPRMTIFSLSDTSTPKLQKIHTEEEDNKWYWEGDLNKTINKMFLNMVAFWSFDYLELSEYPELQEIWHHQVEQTTFCNLKHLSVQNCDFLSNVLLPANLLRVLSKLEELEVRNCVSLEAVFDLSNMNGKEMLVKETFQLKKITLSGLPQLNLIWKHGPLHLVEQALFPNLETVIIKDIQNLKTIWHPFFTLDSLKTLEVKKCEKLESIFPLYMHAAAFASLETLVVDECDSVQQIFELSSEMHTAKSATQLKQMTLLRLPKLKQIWSRDPLNSLRFQNLQVVRVEECHHLEYLLPFSISMDIPQLQEITIQDAESMKEIVSMKEGAMDCPVLFEFNHLTSLTLWDSNELGGFYAQHHNLACPSLTILDVVNCSKLKLFKTKCTNSQPLHVSMHHPLFTLEEVICNLETLTINPEDASVILQGQYSGDHLCKLNSLYVYNFEDNQATFPYWFLQNMSNLNWLWVEWSSFKEIFRDERQIDEIRTRLKKLTLYELHELQHICMEGSQVDPVIEVLEYLDVYQCSNLKHLVPSSVTFSHLTYLEVQNCNGMIYLITSSTATSLVKLRTMKIKECNSLEQIVAQEGEESRDEIAFNCFKILELECLPKLNSFSSSECFFKFLLLEEVIVRQCPRMQNFSSGLTIAPFLKTVKVENGKKRWKEDLNTTVKQLFMEKEVPDSNM